MSARGKSWLGCCPTRKRRTVWCTSSCLAKSARWKLPATCPPARWSMPSKNCGGSRAVDGFGENRKDLTRGKYAGDSAAVHPANPEPRRWPGRNQSAANNRDQAQETYPRADAEATEVATRAGQVVDRRNPRSFGGCRDRGQ